MPFNSSRKKVWGLLCALVEIGILCVWCMCWDPQGKSWVGEFGVDSCATVCYFEENKYFAHVTKYCWGIPVCRWNFGLPASFTLMCWKVINTHFILPFFFKFLNLLLFWSCWFLGKNNTRQSLWSAGWGSERSCCWFPWLGRANYRDKLGKEENGVN